MYDHPVFLREDSRNTHDAERGHSRREDIVGTHDAQREDTFA